MAETLRGADDLADLAKAMKATGDGQLRKDLLAGIRKAGKPAIDAARAEARSSLPSRGGYAAIVGRQPIGVRTRTAGRQAGVRITAQRGIAFGPDKTGFLRHPVFGRKDDTWASQTVPRGWFTETIAERAPVFRKDVEAAMRETAQRIERSV